MSEFSSVVYIEALRRCIDIKDYKKAHKVLNAFECYLSDKPIINETNESVAYKEEPVRKVTKTTKRSSNHSRIDYIPNWKEIRNNIIKRDDGSCRICNKNYSLHVHHIDWDRGNNKESNLVTLCEPCHRAVHKEGYKPWNDDYPAPWNKQEINIYNQDSFW